MLNEPRNTRFSEQRHKIHTLDSCRAYLDGFDRTHNHIWGIYDNGDRHIGNVVASIDPNNQRAELSIIVDHTRSGRGFGTQAWGAVTGWALGRCRKVEAGTMARNGPMIHVCMKCGFDLEGVRPGHFLFEGEPVSMLHFGKFKNGE